MERNRSSFNITARRTYLDLIGAPIYAAINNTNDNKEKIGYNFTDINIKLTRVFSRRNTLSFILFYGNDYLKYKKDEKDSILNRTVSEIICVERGEIGVSDYGGIK